MRTSHRLILSLGIAVVLSLVAAPGCRPGDGGQTGLTADKKAEGKRLKEATRLPWTPASGGFLREWLVCGVFESPSRTGTRARGPDPSGKGFDVDFLQSVGGEAGVRPADGQTVKRPDGTVVTWRPLLAERDEIDLKAVFAGQSGDYVLAYVATTVRSDGDGKAVLALGSDDSVKAWVNGKLVHDNRVGRGVRKDEDVVPIELRKGENHLLLKVDNGWGGWGFAARVLTEAQAAGLPAGEIRPTLAPAKDRPDVLVVNTDAGLGKNIADLRPVHVEAVAAGGKVLASADARRGETIELATKDWPDGPCEVRLWQATADGRRLYRHLPWYKGDWMKQVRELLAGCDKLPARPTKPDDLRLRVIGQLVVHGLGGDPRTDKAARTAPDNWPAVHSPLMEHRELPMGQAAVRPLGFLRLAWVDAIDDSPQFARAYLPPDYDAGKSWPLVVVLHGYNPPNPEYVSWWGVAERHSSLADRNGVIVVEPHGRGNTGYLGIGDADVLRAVREARAAFRVDTRRVYLMGYSMGGGGTWHVGTRHPDVFAAIGPIYGGWDYHVRIDANEIVGLTPRQRYRREASSSFVQADALLTTPVFVNHGDDDALVDVDHSRHVVRMMQRWGYNIRYWEHPGMGHGALGCEDELVGWFLRHRLQRDPRRVRLRAADLKTAAAHWLRAEQREDPYALIVGEAEVTDRSTVRLSTANVLEVRLSPGEVLVDRDKPLRVIWNGEDTGAHAFVNGAVTLRAKGYRPGKLPKTPAIAGPIDALAGTPFAIVVGTASEDPLMRRFCRLRAEAARDGWKEWQKVQPRFFLDSEITDEQIRRYSLQLFGGPEENLVTRRLIKLLPLKIDAERIVIGPQAFDVADASVAMIYPNPLNRARYVHILAGNSPAGMLSAGFLPGNCDFAIDDARVARDAPEDQVRIATGFFDHNWQYDERYVTRGEPAVRAKAAPRKAPTLLTAAGDDRRLWLADLLETRSAGSFAYMMRDANWQGGPIRLGGRTHARGIGVEVWHEPCTVAYDLAGGNWKRLRATIGIEIEHPERLQPKNKEGTKVFFVVRGDGKELYRSETFEWDSRPAEMDVDVAGVKTLELEVNNEATWHNAASSVDWADIRLEK